MLTRTTIVAIPKGTRSEEFLLKSSDAIHLYRTPEAIRLHLRWEARTELDVAATSFRTSVVLPPKHPAPRRAVQACPMPA